MLSFQAWAVWIELTDRPQSLKVIADKVQLPERTVRRLLKELRDNGYNVASRSDKKGYWRGNEIDKRRTISELRSRARAEERTAAALERGPVEGQIEWAVNC